ncbi:hypothetical protein CSKR_202015 [Clonorchis sinensis]|uniref:Uncharacterized protein n=1 Tax=Clonorchis sinensis TaxID=79923 RepID=A0A8T1MZS4_CLOSI|nr:hypothetical protein CSKR_202015 [Clonorchis sinensis]
MSCQHCVFRDQIIYTCFYISIHWMLVHANWEETLNRIQRSSRSGRTTNEELETLSSALNRYSYDYQLLQPLSSNFRLPYDTNSSFLDSTNITLADGSTITAANSSQKHFVNESEIDSSGSLPVQSDDLSVDNQLPPPHDVHKVTEPKTNVQHRWWLLSEICMSIVAMVTHSIWLFLSTFRLFTTHVTARKRVLLLRNDRLSALFDQQSYHLSPSGNRSSDKCLYYGLQFHLGCIGFVYALSFLIGKSFRLSNSPLARPGPTLKKSSPSPWNTFQIVCDITRTTSLILLTVYWLNLMILCVLHVRLVKSLLKVPFSKSEQSRGEHFFYYFHFGASWIYGILLRLASLLFANFPTVQRPILPGKSPVPAAFGVRILSLDCQLCLENAPGDTSPQLACNFSSVELLLELVIDLIGDFAPVIAVTIVNVLLLLLVLKWNRMGRKIGESTVVFDGRGESTGSRNACTNDNNVFNGHTSSVDIQERCTENRQLRIYLGIFLSVITPLGWTACINQVTRITNHLLFVLYTLVSCKSATTWFPTEYSSKHPHYWPNHANDLIEIAILACIPVGIISAHYIPGEKRQTPVGLENLDPPVCTTSCTVDNDGLTNPSPLITPFELLQLNAFSRAEFASQQCIPTTTASIQPDLCTQLCPPTDLSLCTNVKTSYVPISVQVVSLPTFCCQPCTVTIDQGVVTPETMADQSRLPRDHNRPSLELGEKPVEMYILSRADVSPQL